MLYAHSCPCLLVNMCSHFRWLSTWDEIAGSQDRHIFSFFKWLCQCIISLAVYESSGYSTSLPTLGIFSDFHFSHIVVLMLIVLDDE